MKGCLVLSCQQSPLPFRAENSACLDLRAAVQRQRLEVKDGREQASRLTAAPHPPQHLWALRTLLDLFSVRRVEATRGPSLISTAASAASLNKAVNYRLPGSSARLLLRWKASRYECVTTLMWPWWLLPTKRTSPSRESHIWPDLLSLIIE